MTEYALNSRENPEIFSTTASKGKFLKWKFRKKESPEQPGCWIGNFKGDYGDDSEVGKLKKGIVSVGPMFTNRGFYNPNRKIG